MESTPAMRCTLAIPLGFLLLLCMPGCKNDTEIVKGQPELSLSVDSVDFGEVVLGYQSTVGFYATNEGMGELVVDDLSDVKAGRRAGHQASGLRWASRST